ncbi:hypothetical protein Tco_1165106 [Tanacetum coccineum]
MSYHRLFDILNQHQNEVNKIRAKKIARNANPLALVADAQHYPDKYSLDPYYQASKPHKTHTSSSRHTTPTSSLATTRNKSKEIAKPVTSPSESAFEEDMDTSPRSRNNRQYGQFGNHRIVTIVGARETVGNQEEKGVPLSAEQGVWLAEIDEEPDEQEYEAHYMYMAKILEVSTTDSGPTYDAESLEKVHSDDHYNVFATDKQHSKQPESINDTYVMETVDSNVTPDLSDTCDNEGPADQNAENPKDERVLLASLISNFKLDLDENKKSQKELKKVNTSLTRELEKSK